MTDRRNRDDAALALAMLDGVDHPLAAFSTDGRLMLANRAFAAALGLADGADGRNLPAALEAGIAGWLKTIDAPPGTFALDVTDVRGEPKRFKVCGRRLGPEDQGLSILVRLEPAGPIEAAPRKETQGESEAWLRQTLDAMPHKVWIVEPGGAAIYYNKTLRDYIGRPLPPDRASRDRVILHPDDHAAMTRVRDQGAAQGQFALNVRLRRHCGEYRWHHLTVTTVRHGSVNTIHWLVTATDVHDLHVATDQLRSAQERLKLAQTSGRIGIWDFDIVENKATFNTVYCELMGLEPGSEQTYEQFLEMVHEDDRAAVRAANAATMSGKAAYVAEYRIRRPDGAIRWISAKGDAYPDENGRPRRFVGVIIDVSDAKAVAEDRDRLMVQLSDQLQELELLYDSAPIGLGMIDRDMRFQRINTKLAEINGHAAEDHLGRTAWDLVPDLRDEVEPIFRHVFETGVGIADMEISGETPAEPGVTRHWLEQFYPIKDAVGRVRSIGIICEETTQRKDAERRLLESEERLRLATEGAEIGVFEWDPVTDTSIFVNARMHQLLGTQMAVTRSAFLEHFVHPDDRATLRAMSPAENRTPGTALRVSCRVRPNGESEWRYIEFAGEFVPMGENGTPRFLGVARDVTARKQAEETQRLLVAELNHRVKNTLATVQAIANQTLRRARTPADFVHGLTGRLHALSRAHNLLTDHTWTGADLGRLVREQLVIGDAADQRLDISGPPVTLLPQVALRLGLVIHELGTNARKYGALSTPAGNVHVSWTVVRQDHREELELDWTEKKGPPVETPTHRGFGTRLIEASMTALGGTAVVGYRPDGLQCALRMPLQ